MLDTTPGDVGDGGQYETLDVIAALRGPAYGGGFALARAADFREGVAAFLAKRPAIFRDG